MRDADELRKRAEYARQLAAESTDEQIKAFWLSAAKDWETLAMLAENKPNKSSRQDANNSN
jgi:hypothetical protein